LPESIVIRSTSFTSLIGEILGREIKVERRDPNALGKIPPPIRTMFEHYDHHGLLGSPLSLRAILGREPRTLRAYFEEMAAAASESS
jgi:hypothetical protein